MMLIQHSAVNSDWLFNTLSRVLQADWIILGINEQATLNINMPYCLVEQFSFSHHEHNLYKHSCSFSEL